MMAFRLMVQSSNKSVTRQLIISFGSSSSSSSSGRTLGSLLPPWSPEEDQFLKSEFRDLASSVSLEESQMMREIVVPLASKVGRGLGSVRKRLAELELLPEIKVLTKMELQRRQKHQTRQVFDKKEREENLEKDESQKLRPVEDILQRIKWDYSLNSTDFTILYRDRVEDVIMESNFDAPNDSVKGREEQFVFAIPEHRIELVKFRERVVWDKEKRLDYIFGSMNGQGVTISDVAETYDEWIFIKNKVQEIRLDRRSNIIHNLKFILGDEKFERFVEITNLFRANRIVEADAYVASLLGVLEESSSQDTNNIDLDYEQHALADTLSDVAVILFNNQEDLDRTHELLLSIYSKMVVDGADIGTGDMIIPNLQEEDLSEKFVKGGGAGGQKINKTSSKVVLTHNPTKLIVECQDTRSLQQNRKIARKRMLALLDDFYNGSNSKANQKIAQMAKKKAKVKARNKSRKKEKQENTSKGD